MKRKQHQMNRKHAKSTTATWPIKDILLGLSNNISFSEELVYLKWYMMNEPFNHKVEQIKDNSLMGSTPLQRNPS